MTDDQKRWHAAEAALNQAWERLADHNSPANQALACAHLHHNGDAAPMVELLASDDPLHPATRVVLAQWLLDQHRKGKITRAKRGNPNQRHSRQFSIGDLGTFILHPDNPGEMVAARVRERMGVNAAISWVVELLNRLDPNGNPVISEETVERYGLSPVVLSYPICSQTASPLTVPAAASLYCVATTQRHPSGSPGLGLRFHTREPRA